MPSSQFFGQLNVIERLTQTSLIFISILSAIILINDLFENYKYHCLPFFLLSQVDHHQVYLSVPNVVNKGKNLLILHSDKQLSTENKNAGCTNHRLYENSRIRLKMSGKPTHPFDQVFSTTKNVLFLPKLVATCIL